MLSYCLKFRKNTKSKTPEVAKTKRGRIELLSNFSVCNGKKSKLPREQKAKELISKLKGIKVPILKGLTILNAFLKV